MRQALVILACVLSAGCKDSGDLVITNLGLSADSAECGCTGGAVVTLVAGCPLTLTADVATLGGAASHAADGTAVEARLTRLASGSLPAAEVLDYTTTVSDGRIAVPWAADAVQDTVRAEYMLSLFLHASGNESLVPVEVLAPLEPGRPYALCGYWTDASDVPVESAARGADVRLVARLTGDVSGALDVALKVVTADDTTTYVAALGGELSADRTAAEADWTVPIGTSADTLFFDVLVDSGGQPFDATQSGPLHLPGS